MIEHGADVNFAVCFEKIALEITLKAKNNSTPLHYAAFYNDVDLVSILVEAGANLEAFDDFQLNPLLTAICKGHPAVLQALVDNGAKPDVLDPVSTKLNLLVFLGRTTSIEFSY